MGLETGTTIAQLDETWPNNTDPVNQGDDHLRVIKKVLKAQFPGSGKQGFSKAIVATEDELNYLTGSTSNIQSQINALTSGGGDVGAQVAQNTTDINTNKSNISSNTNAISSNSSSISSLNSKPSITAWANVSGPTAAIQGSYGVASIAHTSVGVFDVTTTTSAANAAIVASSSARTSIQQQQSSGFRVVCYDTDGHLTDAIIFSFTVVK